MELNLQDQKVIVTAGAQGIGLALQKRSSKQALKCMSAISMRLSWPMPVPAWQARR